MLAPFPCLWNPTFVMCARALLFGLGLVIATYGCSAPSSSWRGGTDGGGAAGGTRGSRGAAGGSGGVSIPGSGGTKEIGGVGGGDLGTGSNITTGGTVTSGGMETGSTGLGGSVGTSGGAETGGSLGTGGSVAAGGSTSSGGSTGTGGTTGQCGEPVPCDGFDDRPDANLMASISCLSPGAAPASAPLVLSIYGHHLATGPGNNAIVTLGSGLALNGVPITACHLDVQVPANQISAPGQVPVVVSPGGWILQSPPLLLTLR